MTDPIDESLHDDLGTLDGTPVLPEASDSSETTYPQPAFMFTRHTFELFLAGAALSGVRHPKDVDKIYLRAETLADHYEQRGFFAEGATPLRLEEFPGFFQEEEDPMAQQPPMVPPRARTKDGRNVRVVGEGNSSAGMEPKAFANAAGRKAVVVGGKRPPTQFVGRSVVNATNGPHRPGQPNRPPGPVQTISRNPPPPRPSR